MSFLEFLDRGALQNYCTFHLRKDQHSNAENIFPWNWKMIHSVLAPSLFWLFGITSGVCGVFASLILLELCALNSTARKHAAVFMLSHGVKQAYFESDKYVFMVWHFLHHHTGLRIK